MSSGRERLVVCSEQGLAQYEFESESQSSEFPREFTNLEDTPPWKSSESYLDSNNASAFPVITITEPTIWVYWQAIGNAAVSATTLTGPDGSYTFTTANTSYSVNPGRYTHRVAGRIVSPPAGRIASGIRYK